jgi:Sulfatase-modifying factor enzyme 1
MAGNVWEWTDSCFVRTRLDAQNEVLSDVVNCGVRLVEGRHRTFVPEFIRDARAGGCAAGTPPSNLGFRLVRRHAAKKGGRRRSAPRHSGSAPPLNRISLMSRARAKIGLRQQQEGRGHGHLYPKPARLGS